MKLDLTFPIIIITAIIVGNEYGAVAGWLCLVILLYLESIRQK